MSSDATYAATKRQTIERLHAIVDCPLAELDTAVSRAYAADAAVRAFHPVNDIAGAADIASKLWAPIRQSFPDIERRDWVVASGEYQDRTFVCALSLLQGTFATDWHGIPATHGVAALRCGEFNELRDGQIVSTHMIIDTLDLMLQAGCCPIGPSLGAEHAWEAPATQDGAVLDGVDSAAGVATMKVIKAMHNGLMAFDGDSLASMDHARFWTPNFMWYGPAGIGTTRGLSGFEAHHQIPFLRGFPDRKVASHIANVADSNYAVTGGWPSVVATHSGPDWLNVGPTGRKIAMRVMDFYRLDDGLIAENWVPIDITDILRQMGIDLFGRIRHRRGVPRRDVS
ncbi:MAG: ester cyclase [Pseudomonadota bacterium]